MNTLNRRNRAFPLLINELLNHDWMGGVVHQMGKIPAANIKENEKDFELSLLVPGRSKKDFKIEVDKNVLTISATLKDEEVTKESVYTRREFSIADFTRSFTLPNSIDLEKIKASYKEGIMTLSLPKNAASLPKPKRLISLN